jgi:hypothetical protein
MQPVFSKLCKMLDNGPTFSDYSCPRAYLMPRFITDTQFELLFINRVSSIHNFSTDIVELILPKLVNYKWNR